jgi:glycosyltransferase A (GT-A) superfamily protein (DUF2064 family)
MRTEYGEPVEAHLLVLAKAPEPGLVKTRLAVSIGDVAAAEVAAAALLDTLETCVQAVGAQHCHLALAGDLGRAVEGAAIGAALTGWTVRPQRGDRFADRLVQAHSAVSGPVVQVGMDTPQMTPAQLRAAAAALADHRAALGPADDGGWWVLALRDPHAAQALADVPMSTPTTFDRTQAALRAHGLEVATVDNLRDVDTAVDADVVSAAVPDSRFAVAWGRHA